MPAIAVLSTAHIHTKGFLENLAKLVPSGKPHVIWDDVPERGRAYAEKHGCPFNPDLDAVVADPAVDGFLICAENTRHLRLLEKALPAGKPVLCEKPLGVALDDARRIAALVKDSGAPLCSGYFQPFFGRNRAVKGALAEGRLGKVTHAYFRNAHHAAYGRWFDSPDLAWFTQPELSGGGALLDMGTHAVHLLRHLFGPVEKVWALTRNVAGVYPAVDDYGLILLQFASGVVAQVEAAWVYTGKRGGLEIVGSAATYCDGSIVAPGQEASPLADLPPAPDRVERLLAIIRGEIPAAELAEDLSASLDAVAIMAAAYESAASGVWQKVAAF